MPADLTKRQREVLDTITRLTREAGYAPTHREIGAALSLASVHGVHQHVTALVRKGFLTRKPGASRSLVPVQPEPPPAQVPLPNLLQPHLMDLRLVHDRSGTWNLLVDAQHPPLIRNAPTWRDALLALVALPDAASAPRLDLGGTRQPSDMASEVLGHRLHGILDALRSDLLARYPVPTADPCPDPLPFELP